MLAGLVENAGHAMAFAGILIMLLGVAVEARNRSRTAPARPAVRGASATSRRSVRR